MWIVFDKGNKWSQGYSVECETEAREICKGNKDITYCYINLELLTA